MRTSPDFGLSTIDQSTIDLSALETLPIYHDYAASFSNAKVIDKLPSTVEVDGMDWSLMQEGFAFGSGQQGNLDMSQYKTCQA